MKRKTLTYIVQDDILEIDSIVLPTFHIYSDNASRFTTNEASVREDVIDPRGDVDSREWVVVY